MIFLALACVAPREAGEADFWAPPADAAVDESIPYTAEPYGLDGGIGALADAVFPTSDDTVAFGPDDAYSTNDCDTSIDEDLPREVTGVATLDSRYYFKTEGCSGDDEKYYGSFFIQDDTGGLFVLGDTKAGTISAGDVVTLRVRGVRTSFDLDMVYAWDLVSNDTTGRAVHYDVAVDALGDEDVAKVVRIEGTVMSEPDTFGEFVVEHDSGTRFTVQMDTDLNRRPVSWPIGTRLQVTGPVLYSYSVYSVVLMSLGQVAVLEEAP